MSSHIDHRKRAEIEQALRRNPASSNRSVAIEAGTSHPTVAKIRAELVKAGKLADPRLRKTSDGQLRLVKAANGARGADAAAANGARGADGELTDDLEAELRQVLIGRARAGDAASARWILEHWGHARDAPSSGRADLDQIRRMMVPFADVIGRRA